MVKIGERLGPPERPGKHRRPGPTRSAPSKMGRPTTPPKVSPGRPIEAYSKIPKSISGKGK